MTEKEVLDSVTAVMRETFEDDTLVVDRSTTADDVEDWDSISNIELLVALETALGVRFNTGEIAGLANVGELVDLIVGRIIP